MVVAAARGISICIVGKHDICFELCCLLNRSRWKLIFDRIVLSRVLNVSVGYLQWFSKHILGFTSKTVLNFFDIVSVWHRNVFDVWKTNHFCSWPSLHNWNSRVVSERRLLQRFWNAVLWSSKLSGPLCFALFANRRPSIQTIIQADYNKC